MISQVNPRRAALAALCDFRASGRLSDKALNKRLHDFSELDRALILRLVYGVLQHYYKLDGCIKRASSVPWSKLQPQTKDILRLGAYQLLYLSKIPKSAAVNESVKLVQACKLGSRVQPFVNAVLRNISQWEEIPSFNELWIETSHPEWLANELIKQYGIERATELLHFNNRQPPIYLQILKPEYAERLNAAGAVPHPVFKGCMTYTGNVEKLPGFAEGAFIVADNAARMAVEAAAPASGERVLDACAAPGGKSVMLSYLANNDISLTSCDISETKVPILQETLAKYSVHGVQYRMDAGEFRADLEESFDLVLADVPCSGIGVIRKKPDIRYKQKEDIESLPLVQSRILCNLSHYVKRGGRLVYVTCTLLNQENHSVVADFLKKHTQFSLEPFSITTGDVPAGEITIWPTDHDTDGFYIARLRRTR